MKTLRFIYSLGAMLLCLGLTTSFAQNVSVSGRVTDTDNNPLKGVSVAVKNAPSVNTVTDSKGIYSITVKSNDIIVYSLDGYVTQEAKASKSVINVKLKAQVALTTDIINITRDDKKIESETVLYDYMEDASVTYAAQGITARESAYTGADRGKRTARVQMLQMPAQYHMPNTEEFNKYKENRFINVSKDPLSTFSLEVDGASYSNVRRMINNGAMPPKDAVRVEEFINYFSYDYQKPTGKDPLKISYEIAPCPWNEKHQLVSIGVKAKEIPSDNIPATNFVFLVDVSGSMYGQLPLVKSSLKLLVNNLRDNDRIAIVAYAGAAGEVLPSTPGTDKQKIREALDNLTAGGSTAGGAGIKLAYKIARQNFIKDGNNRIILATDGDFNVGVSSNEGLESLVEQERKSGVFLTVLGYGMGNYKDSKMQVLAEKGNGNYAYINDLQEANKVLVNEFGGTMYTVAKDVKLQIEFNPAKVQSFRLVGYESRLLEHEDFNDDTKDAGEIGAGHSVTAFYEIVPVGIISNSGSIDPLKYQPVNRSSRVNDSQELMTVKLRYKAPDGDTSEKIEVPVVNRGGKLSEDFYFAASVAMFGQLLKDSDFKGDATYDKVIETARKGLGNDHHGYRREFVRLAETVKGMSK